jgi:hypothetical protein
LRRDQPAGAAQPPIDAPRTRSPEASAAVTAALGPGAVAAREHAPVSRAAGRVDPRACRRRARSDRAALEKRGVGAPPVDRM